jgi:DNA-binding MarR family transcriptional regulator
MQEPDNKMNELVASIFAVMRVVREHAQKRHKRDPFSILQLETLNYVSVNGQPTMKDISNYLCITPPSATSIVNGLVKAGKLERIPDPRDRRIVRLSATAKGKREAGKWYAEKTARMKKIFAVLSEKERGDIVRMFTKISKAHHS